MPILEGGYLSVRVGQSQLGLHKLTPGNQFCDCCAATYSICTYGTFYGIAVSEERSPITGAVTTDVVILPDGNTLYVTLATEAFQRGYDDDY